MILAIALASTLLPPKQTMVCIGDSLTGIYGPYLVNRLSQDYDVKVVLTTNKLPTDLDIAKAIAAKPSIIILSEGKDFAWREGWGKDRDSFVPTLVAAIGRLKGSESHPKVFITLPELATVAQDPESVVLQDQVIPLLKQVAREAECPVIDFSAFWNDPDARSHLNSFDFNGRDRMAFEILDAISVGRQSEWRVVYVDSQEADEGPAVNAIDGDPDTYWHTNYSTSQEKYPHEIQIDTGIERPIYGFTYLPRQDGVNGRVKQYEFYVSLDGKNWGKAVAKGEFKPGSDLSKVHFQTVYWMRYFKFRALSEQQGQIWASASELNLLKFYPAGPSGK